MACYGQCYSGHVYCTCNSRCGCHSDNQTCNAKRATSNARQFSWTRSSIGPNAKISTSDINNLRNFLKQEQNSRSAPSPAPGTVGSGGCSPQAYNHPGSCTIQTTTWTGVISDQELVKLGTYNQLITLLLTLRTRAITQHASMSAPKFTGSIPINSKISLSHINRLRDMLTESYQQCICASKSACNCAVYCACQNRTTCSTNGCGQCGCYGACSCASY